MTSKRSRAACVAVLALAAFAQADEASVLSASRVFEKHRDAVVWVTAVLKVTTGFLGAEMGHAVEQKVEALGTLIHPSGLTVVSYTMLDPTRLFGGYEIPYQGESEKVEFKSIFSDVKILLADGTELPAKLVLKDPDLDLAFIRPDRSADTDAALKEHTILKLEKGPELDVLDEVICLSRLGKALDRQPSITVNWVSAVVKRPRKLYALNGLATLGTPVFSADGRVVGIAVMRTMKDPDSMWMMMSASFGGGLSPVVLPAEDVQEVASQAMPEDDQRKAK